MTSKRDEPRVFFPWEKRRGLRGLLSRGRARQVIAVLALGLLFLLVQRRERALGDVRATRAVITATTRA
ncbi:MAG: hypothetical protein JOZ69_16140, partial [Myxococcales bacterium]|nr:hypothetical protein [Myxococcales bacterium]